MRDLAVLRWIGGGEVEERWTASTSLPAGMTSPSRQLEWIEHDVIASKSSCEGGDRFDQVFRRAVIERIFGKAEPLHAY